MLLKHYVARELASLNDMEQVCLRYQGILQNDAPLPSDEPLLLAAPLAEAINIAEASEQNIDAETRAVPARWPTFDGGCCCTPSSRFTIA